MPVKPILLAMMACVKRRTTIGMVSDATKKGVSYL